MTAWLQVGIVGKAHGLRGHFYVSERSLPLPAACDQLRMGADPERPELTLSLLEASFQQHRPLILCKELIDRTAVEKCMGKPLWMDRVHAGEGLIWADLISKPLIDSEGVLVGLVKDVANFGANDSLIIEHSERKGSLHIPLVAAYIDLSFKPGDPHLKLLVPKTYFDEFWNV